MKESETKKSIQGHKTFKEFCQQFGDDEYSQTLLEILFEGLMYEETIFILGQPQQTRDQINHDSSK